MVFVLDRHKKPLDPCCEKRARALLTAKQAVIHKRFPFTIRLKARTLTESTTHPVRIKIDPGSKTTGLALLRDDTVIMLGELIHKTGIKAALESRRSLRRGRRNRKTRYRKPRFLNRANARTKGKLPPSLVARVQQTTNLLTKLRSLIPIGAISTEHVKFDTQLMENPDIQGIEYQRGALMGYEVKEYLLERDGRKCAYCKKENVPLEVEHIQPRSRGGSDRVSNLTIACRPCNQAKNNQTAAEFGHPDVQKNTKRTLKDAAMVNATRWRLFEDLKRTGLPVECGTGARTKWQRLAHGLPKEHYFDAVCVGKSTPEHLTFAVKYISIFKATGRGKRQMCRTDKFGFPLVHRQRKKLHFGFQTGDIVKASNARCPEGQVGRMIANAKGGFYWLTSDRKHFNFAPKNTRLLQRADGWSYSTQPVKFTG